MALQSRITLSNEINFIVETTDQDPLVGWDKTKILELADRSENDVDLSKVPVSFTPKAEVGVDLQTVRKNAGLFYPIVVHPTTEHAHVLVQELHTKGMSLWDYYSQMGDSLFDDVARWDRAFRWSTQVSAYEEYMKSLVVMLNLPDAWMVGENAKYYSDLERVATSTKKLTPFQRGVLRRALRAQPVLSCFLYKPPDFMWNARQLEVVDERTFRRWLAFSGESEHFEDGDRDSLLLGRGPAFVQNNVEIDVPGIDDVKTVFVRKLPRTDSDEWPDVWFELAFGDVEVVRATSHTSSSEELFEAVVKSFPARITKAGVTCDARVTEKETFVEMDLQDLLKMGEQAKIIPFDAGRIESQPDTNPRYLHVDPDNVDLEEENVVLNMQKVTSRAYTKDIENDVEYDDGIVDDDLDPMQIQQLYAAADAAAPAERTNFRASSIHPEYFTTGNKRKHALVAPARITSFHEPTLDPMWLPGSCHYIECSDDLPTYGQMLLSIGQPWAMLGRGVAILCDAKDNDKDDKDEEDRLNFAIYWLNQAYQNGSVKADAACALAMAHHLKGELYMDGEEQQTKLRMQALKFLGEGESSEVYDVASALVNPASKNDAEVGMTFNDDGFSKQDLFVPLALPEGSIKIVSGYFWKRRLEDLKFMTSDEETLRPAPLLQEEPQEYLQELESTLQLRTGLHSTRDLGMTQKPSLSQSGCFGAFLDEGWHDPKFEAKHAEQVTAAIRIVQRETRVMNATGRVYNDVLGRQRDLYAGLTGFAVDAAMANPVHRPRTFANEDNDRLVSPAKDCRLVDPNVPPMFKERPTLGKDVDENSLLDILSDTLYDDIYESRRTLNVRLLIYSTVSQEAVKLWRPSLLLSNENTGTPIYRPWHWGGKGSYESLLCITATENDEDEYGPIPMKLEDKKDGGRAALIETVEALQKELRVKDVVAHLASCIDQSWPEYALNEEQATTWPELVGLVRLHGFREKLAPSAQSVKEAKFIPYLSDSEQQLYVIPYQRGETPSHQYRVRMGKKTSEGTFVWWPSKELTIQVRDNRGSVFPRIRSVFLREAIEKQLPLQGLVVNVSATGEPKVDSKLSQPEIDGIISLSSIAHRRKRVPESWALIKQNNDRGGDSFSFGLIDNTKEFQSILYENYDARKTRSNPLKEPNFDALIETLRTKSEKKQKEFQTSLPDEVFGVKDGNSDEVAVKPDVYWMAAGCRSLRHAHSVKKLEQKLTRFPKLSMAKDAKLQLACSFNITSIFEETDSKISEKDSPIRRLNFAQLRHSHAEKAVTVERFGSRKVAVKRRGAFFCAYDKEKDPPYELRATDTYMGNPLKRSASLSDRTDAAKAQQMEEEYFATFPGIPCANDTETLGKLLRGRLSIDYLKSDPNETLAELETLLSNEAVAMDEESENIDEILFSRSRYEELCVEIGFEASGALLNTMCGLMKSQG